MKTTARRTLALFAVAVTLGGCELIAEFDRTKIDGGGLDSSFPDVPTADVTPDSPADTGVDAGKDAADGSSDAADGSSADGSSDAADAADVGVDATADAADAAADADAGTAQLTIAPTTIDFGNMTTTVTSVDVLFTVKNTGTATSGTAAASISGTDNTQFIIGSTNTCTSTLAPNATCTVQVHFAPTATGTKSASLDVAATPGGTASAPLSGNGVAATQFSISPTSFAFGDQAINASSSPHTFTVTNNSGTTSAALAIAFGGGDSTQFTLGTDNCTGQTIAASGNCTVDVVFHPTSTGQKAASMTVGDVTNSAVASVGGNGI